jgi:hypothetical protein
LRHEDPPPRGDLTKELFVGSPRPEVVIVLFDEPSIRGEGLGYQLPEVPVEEEAWGYAAAPSAHSYRRACSTSPRARSKSSEISSTVSRAMNRWRMTSVRMR